MIIGNKKVAHVNNVVIHGSKLVTKMCKKLQMKKNWKSIKWYLFSARNKRRLLLDFIYWRETEIHPADANNIVNKFLEQKKYNNSY